MAIHSLSASADFLLLDNGEHYEGNSSYQWLWDISQDSLYAPNKDDWANIPRRLLCTSFRWAPPLAWNHHMTLCTQHWLCALTGERVKIAPNQSERGRRSLINDHMLRESSSRQIRWLSSTWRKSTDPVHRESLTQRQMWRVVYFFCYR